MNTPSPLHEIVDVRKLWHQNDPAAQMLFNKGFEIYCQCFPDENEREPSEILKGYLADPNADWHMFIAKDSSGRIIGGRNVNVLKTTIGNQLVPFAWGEHLYVNPAPEFRRKGIGSAIAKATNQLLAASGILIIFSEQNDPFLMSPEEYASDLNSGISPEDRLLFWGKLGYKAINAPYLQPPLEGGQPVRYLRLCCLIPNPSTTPTSITPTPETLNAKTYLHLVRHFHSTFVPNLDSDPTSNELKNLITSGPTSLPLIEITQKRTFLQDT